MTSMPDKQDIEIISLVDKLHQVPERSPRASADGRAKFLAEAQTYSLPVSRQPERRHIEWNTIFSRKAHPRMTTISALVVIISLLLGGTGATVVAAQGSLPDQPLYAVKLASEDVRAGLTTNSQTRLGLATSFADVRLDEILQLAAQGKTIPSSVWERLQAQYELALNAATVSNDVQLQRDLLQIQAKIAVNLDRLAVLSADSQYASAAANTQAAMQNYLQLIALGLQDPGAFRQIMATGLQNRRWQTIPPASSLTPLPMLPSPTPVWRATDNHGGYMMTPWPNATAHPQYPMMTPVPGNNSHYNDPWMGSPTQMPNNQWHDGCMDCGQWNGMGGGGGSWGGGGMGGGHH